MFPLLAEQTFVSVLQWKPSYYNKQTNNLFVCKVRDNCSNLCKLMQSLENSFNENLHTNLLYNSQRLEKYPRTFNHCGYLKVKVTKKFRVTKKMD